MRRRTGTNRPVRGAESRRRSAVCRGRALSGCDKEFPRAAWCRAGASAGLRQPTTKGDVSAASSVRSRRFGRDRAGSSNGGVHIIARCASQNKLPSYHRILCFVAPSQPRHAAVGDACRRVSAASYSPARAGRKRCVMRRQPCVSRSARERRARRSSAPPMAQASERSELTAVRRGPDLRQSRSREKAMLAESRRLWWLVSGDVEVTAAGLSA